MRRPNEWARRWLGLCVLVCSGCNEQLPAPAASSLDVRPQSIARPSQTTAPFAPLAPSTTSSTGLTTSHVAAPSSALHYERLTLGGADPDAALPWVVAFHGLGDDPRGFAQLFSRVPLRAHVYLAQAPLPHGSGFDWFGEGVTGDPERLTLAVQRRLGDVTSLLDTLASQPQNRGDAVVTGFSQGGVLSFAIAVAGLRHVRAAVPIAGWLPPNVAASGLVLPTYAFHGEQDQIVPFATTKRMIASWQPTSIELEYRTYPGVAHTISANMHRDWVDRLGELLR